MDDVRAVKGYSAPRLILADAARKTSKGDGIQMILDSLSADTAVAKAAHRAASASCRASDQTLESEARDRASSACNATTPRIRSWSASRVRSAASSRLSHASAMTAPATVRSHLTFSSLDIFLTSSHPSERETTASPSLLLTESYFASFRCAKATIKLAMCSHLNLRLFTSTRAALLFPEWHKMCTLLTRPRPLPTCMVERTFLFT